VSQNVNEFVAPAAFFFFEIEAVRLPQRPVDIFSSEYVFFENTFSLLPSDPPLAAN